MSEVDAVLRKLGLEKYRETLASHGLYTMEDLRQGKGVLQLALPLGPKARLLKELNATEGEESLGNDEYSTLIQILRPYAGSLTTLVSRLADAGRRQPGGVAGRHYLIASTTLKLCEKAIKDSLRYQTLARRGPASNVQADMSACKVAVGSSVRQLRQQQRQGILRSLDDADPTWPLPTLDLTSVTIGQVLSPPKRGSQHHPRQRGPFARDRDASVLDVHLLGQLRALKQPPEIVVTTILMMLRLFGYEEGTWAAAKARLGSQAFLQELQKFNEAEVPDSVLSVVGDYCTDPDTSPELVKLASTEASVVSGWVRRVYTSCSATRSGGGGGDSTARSAPGGGAAADGSAGQAAPLPAAAPSPIISPTRFDPAEAYVTPPRREREVEHIDTSRQADSDTLARAERNKEKEEWLVREELRLKDQEKRVQHREKLVDEAMARLADAAAKSAEAAAAAPAALPPTLPTPTPGPSVDMSQLISQMDSLKAALQSQRGAPAAAPAAEGRDAALMSRINSLMVAAATSRALLAHVIQQQEQQAALRQKARQPSPDDSEDEECEGEGRGANQASPALATPPGGIPVGSHVEVTLRHPGFVTGHSRGRVGVELRGGGGCAGAPREVGAVPHNLCLAEEEMRDLPSEYPVGTPVSVGGAAGVVSGHSRGRIGVELRSGKKVGAVPEKVHIMSEDDIARLSFPVGLDVVFLQEGTITGTSRGRLGVLLSDGVTRRGVIPEQVIKPPPCTHLDSLYPKGTPVIFKEGGKSAVVSGVARGRVGLVLPDGKAASALPDQIVREDSKEGLLLEYPVGMVVTVKSTRGTVVSHKRGRVGVELDDGSHVGAVPAMLREAVLSDAELKEKYEPGMHVAVGGMRGVITGISRGRLGVEFRDGTKSGAMPANVTLLTDDQVNREFHPNGLEVNLVQEGTVTGCARGRVGVLLSNGSRSGVVPEQITRCPERLHEAFPTGTPVVVKASNKPGKVTGISRGRIGVELDGGEVLGLIPDQIMRQDSKEGLLLDYPIGSVVRIALQRGMVVSHTRGRVGVELDSTGEVVGALPANLRVVQLSDAELKEKYTAGMPVEVGCRRATIAGISRGRIGVEFDDGTKAGLTPERIRILTESERLAQKFPVNAAVEWTEVLEGTLVGSSRGRVGVLLADGRKVGCMPDQVRPKHLPAKDALPVGCSVDVTLKAKVTGHHRGRVGVELNNGTKLGVMPDALVKTSAPEDFAAGTQVLHDGRLAKVVGHSRGRVGIEYQNGDHAGVVPPQLRKAPRKRVAASVLASLHTPPAEKSVKDIVDRALNEHHALVADVYTLLNDVQ